MNDFCNAMRQAQKDGVDNKTLSDEWIDTSEANIKEYIKSQKDYFHIKQPMRQLRHM